MSAISSFVGAKAKHSAILFIGSGRDFDRLLAEIARELVGPETPFRLVDSTMSPIGITGGPKTRFPGEMELAQGGVLYLRDVQKMDPKWFAYVVKAWKKRKDEFVLFLSAYPENAAEEANLVTVMRLTNAFAIDPIHY